MVSRKSNTYKLRRRTRQAGGPATMPGMQIQLNGQSHSAAVATVAELLQTEGLAERRVAVEVNGEIVPRSAHATHTLHDGDRVEIVHALGGG